MTSVGLMILLKVKTLVIMFLHFVMVLSSEGLLSRPLYSCYFRWQVMGMDVKIVEVIGWGVSWVTFPY